MAYERIITMFGYLDTDAANQYMALLLHLKNEDAKKKVTLYLNLVGGDIAAGLALRDTMSTMPFEIETVNVGVCGDIGAYLAASGTKGKRCAMPSSKFRLAGPRMYPPTDREGKPVRVPMQASDLQIEVEQVLRDKKLLLEGFSKFTGQSVDKLNEDFRRDFYLTAKEAVEYGLVDQIIEEKE
jgi:ATP-dependent Clp protease protease subunit